MVRCECGKSRRLYEAGDPELNALGTCTGARPWLGSDTGEPGGQPARLLVRTATNAYFPQDRERAVAPGLEGGSARCRRRAIWDDLRIVDDVAELATLKKKPKVARLLEPFSDEQVLEAIDAVKAGADADRPLAFPLADPLPGDTVQLPGQPDPGARLRRRRPLRHPPVHRKPRRRGDAGRPRATGPQH